MNEQKIERILNNAKRSMEIEGFVIDKELEDEVRNILLGEVDIKDYIEQVKLDAMRYAAHEV